MATTTMVAALAQLSGTTARLTKMVTQLKARRLEGNVVLQLFVATMEAALAGVLLRGKQPQAACDLLERCIPVFLQCQT
jgi:hypothetical protein